MARPQKVEAYLTVNKETEIRIYEGELRRLLGLPRRNGTFTGAEFKDGRLMVGFRHVKGGQIHI